MYISIPGAVVGLALFGGVVMAPYRAFQAVSGRLVSEAASRKSLRLVTTLFLFAFVFWMAVIWAAYNIEIRRSCSGDNCIGYMLLGMPFPFIYAWAEVLLFRIRQSGSSGKSPGSEGAD